MNTDVPTTTLSQDGISVAATQPASPRALDRLINVLQTPVDLASLVVFRIGFGLIAAWWAFDYLRTGRVAAMYIAPQIHFTYWPFTWGQPWPGAGPYLHFLAMAFLGLGIAVGIAYRWMTILFAIAFTIFFLWDRTNYQNHYYLILLISWVMTLLPLNRLFSLDTINHPESKLSSAPLWGLWLIRFHVALPYVFGGLAKLDPEWLAGAGLRDYLVTKSSMPLVGSWLGTQHAAVAIAWGGLFFDLSIVPLLLWKPTRIAAYSIAVLFHICNHFLFSIHIFPWFMIVATTMFFDPSWPRRLLRIPAATISTPPPSTWSTMPFRARVGCVLLVAYVCLQVLLPLRHHLYEGDISWHERGHFFAWRMMLRTKRAVIRVYMTDQQIGETWNVDLLRYINQEQLMKCARDPEMLLDLALQLSKRYQLKSGRTPEVRMLVLVCYNGRKPQLFIDPTVDLVQAANGTTPRSWIMPQSEPLASEPWQRPVSEWQQAVNLPPLPQITRGPRGEKIVRN